MSNEINLSTKEMLEALENDNNYKMLKQKYESPNEFTIMGNKRREEWHSSFVGWVLDPKGNHKLGAFPLEKFLDLIESKIENLEINRTDIVDMAFETEAQTKDGRRIDVLGISGSLMLVIENKIKASETFKNGIPQSVDYFEYCEERYKDRQRCYVLLKAFSNSCVANENFISITYQELFDEVLSPSLEKCQELKIEDTGRVLEQYALDISNPSANIILANTQKDLSNDIYEKHSEIIEKIRVTMANVDSDDESDICIFFNKNEQYINNTILRSIGKTSIKRRTDGLKKLKGDELINALMYHGYIKPEYTELIYKCMSATCIIMVDRHREFYTGYYLGDYDGSQEVEVLQSGFKKLREAQIVVEKEVGSKKVNGGTSAYELTLLNSGIKEAEGKKIGDILEKL